jgi:hypothetical protein
LQHLIGTCRPDGRGNTCSEQTVIVNDASDVRALAAHTCATGVGTASCGSLLSQPVKGAASLCSVILEACSWDDQETPEHRAKAEELRDFSAGAT